jgi:O-antigen/teichoic acid export membrane protein
VNEALSAAQLREAALSGARWTASARLVAETAAFASGIVLARLIPPADFGRAAVALIAVSLAAVLGTPGLVAPVVQRRELARDHVVSATFLAIGCGVLMTVLTVLFGLVLAPAIFGDRTANLIVLAAPAWLLVGAGATSQAVMQRQLRFRRLSAIESVAVVMGAAVALIAAVAGVDAEALVFGALVLVGVISLFSLVLAPPPRARPTRRGAADIWRGAAPVAGSSLVYLVYRNVDYAILGARATAAQVGFYWRAYQLGVAYQGKISRVMLRVSFPVYSRAPDLETLRRIRAKIVRTHATVLVPLLAMFAGVAPVLVPWLFGPSWEPAVVPAQIMSVAGMADAITSGTAPLLVALGRPRALLYWNLVVLALYAILIAVLAPHGLVPVAVGVAVFGVGTVLGLQLVLLRRYVGLSFSQLWLDVRAGVVIGLLVFASTSLLRLALAPAELPDVVVLAALGGTALVVYAVVLRLAFPEGWDDLAAIARTRRGKPATARPMPEAIHAEPEGSPDE